MIYTFIITHNLYFLNHDYDYVDLHDGVVDGDEGSEQVQISGGEDQREQQLRLPRNTWKTQQHTSEHNTTQHTHTKTKQGLEFLKEPEEPLNILIHTAIRCHVNTTQTLRWQTRNIIYNTRAVRHACV